MKKIWEYIKKFFCWLGVLFTTIFTIIFFNKKKKKQNQDESSIKQEKENEIKETDASTLVANSPNQDDIQHTIEQEQSKFYQRIRDRLKQKL